jgi:two-component system sensor histidine kinase YesM
MFIEVRGKVLTETLNTIQFGQTGYAYVIDQGNRFAYHRDSSLFGQASDLILPNRTQVMNIKDREMMMIPADLENGWRVGGIVPVQELVASSIEIRDLTVWIALASAVVAVIIGFFVTRKIGRPLIQLSKLMKRSEAGDLSVRFNITGKNEIGQLGQSFNKMIRQIDVLIQRIAKEENEKKKAEIRAMRYQINPHFLFNTLNSIRWMAKLQRTEDVANAVSTLVHLLEASLERSGSIVKLGEELELLEKYMIIQQYRYNNGITLKIHSPRELADITMPRMLLQPIVENAIFHGIAPKENEGSIEVTVTMKANNAVIVIKDDGMGIKKDKLPHLLTGKDSTRTTGMTRIGLFHVHQTLQLYYGAPYGVQVESTEGYGTSVILTFPIKKAATEYDSKEAGIYPGEGDEHERISSSIG